MMRSIRNRKRGFTIIELLIVIAIIAILAAVAIPSLIKARRSGQESGAEQVLAGLRSAEETYRKKNNTYGDLDELQTDGLSPVGEDGVDANSGYTFSSEAGTDQFTIIATPPGDGYEAYTVTEAGRL